MRTKAILTGNLSLFVLKARVSELERKGIVGLSTFQQNIIRAIKEAKTEGDLHANKKVRSLIDYNLDQLERTCRIGDYAVTTNCINGELAVEDLVLVSGEDEYAYMVGTVIELIPHGSPNRHTDNVGVDVMVDFTDTPYTTQRLNDLIRGFKESLGGGIEEPTLDKVILAPSTLIRITELDTDTYTQLLEDRDFAFQFCRQMLIKSA